MEGAYGSSVRGRGTKSTIKGDKVAEASAKYSAFTPDQALKEIVKLEKKMFQHAKDLEFEEAAQVRDEINQLRAQVIKAG